MNCCICFSILYIFFYYYTTLFFLFFTIFFYLSSPFSRCPKIISHVKGRLKNIFFLYKWNRQWCLPVSCWRKRYIICVLTNGSIIFFERNRVCINVSKYICVFVRKLNAKRRKKNIRPIFNVYLLSTKFYKSPIGILLYFLYLFIFVEYILYFFDIHWVYYLNTIHSTKWPNKVIHHLDCMAAKPYVLSICDRDNQIIKRSDSIVNYFYVKKILKYK